MSWPMPMDLRYLEKWCHDQVWFLCVLPITAPSREFLQQRGQPQAGFVGQWYYLKMLWKLQGASFTEDVD